MSNVIALNEAQREEVMGLLHELGVDSDKVDAVTFTEHEAIIRWAGGKNA